VVRIRLAALALAIDVLLTNLFVGARVAPRVAPAIDVCFPRILAFVDQAVDAGTMAVALEPATARSLPGRLEIDEALSVGASRLLAPHIIDVAITISHALRRGDEWTVIGVA
jgi:hypothetical protein